jgi:hypothetical protein
MPMVCQIEWGKVCLDGWVSWPVALWSRQVLGFTGDSGTKLAVLASVRVVTTLVERVAHPGQPKQNA